MVSISAQLNQILHEINGKASLVAVSKMQTPETILKAYEAGQRKFGENKVQELADKAEQLPKDIQWHFIGHLQTNKVKYLAPFVSLIESADRLKLLQVVDKEAMKNKRCIDLLLQFHIATEENKFGFHMAEAENMLCSESFRDLKHIRICGVMGMATYTENEEQIRNEFKSLKAIFDKLKATYFADHPEFKHISMGMSGDYRIAIEEGSTMVRIGSAIFGPRNFH